MTHWHPPSRLEAEVAALLASYGVPVGRVNAYGVMTLEPPVTTVFASLAGKRMLWEDFPGRIGELDPAAVANTLFLRYARREVSK